MCTDPKVQRLKIPSCPKCNDTWQKHEAHFRTVMVACGLNVTPHRQELWEAVTRGFGRGPEGERERARIRQILQPSPILTAAGVPYNKLYPHRDASVVEVVKKIVRGLTYKLDPSQFIPADRLIIVDHAEAEMRPPADIVDTVFEVPHVFTGRAFVFADPEIATKLHSTWVLDFFDNVTLCAAIMGPEYVLPGE